MHDVERDGKYAGTHGLQMEKVEAIDLGGLLSVCLRVCWRKKWRTKACANIEDALDKFDSYLQERAKNAELEQEKLF